MNWLRELARRLKMLVPRHQFDTDLEEDCGYAPQASHGPRYAAIPAGAISGGEPRAADCLRERCKSAPSAPDGTRTRICKRMRP